MNMALQDKRERFKCQQTSSGYFSSESQTDNVLAKGNTYIKEMETQREKQFEYSNALTSCNSDEGKENDVYNCNEQGVSPDLDKGKENAMDNVEELGFPPDLTDFQADKGKDNVVDNCENGNLLNSKDESLDITSTVNEDRELLSENAEVQITIKSYCECETIPLSIDIHDSVEQVSSGKITDTVRAVVHDMEGLVADGGAIPKSGHAFYLNTDVVDGSVETFRVEQMEMIKTDIIKSQTPKLFSQVSTTSSAHHQVHHAANMEITESCDGQGRSSSTSSLASNMSDYKIMKRRSAVVKIAGDTDFFRLQTVKYIHHKQKSRQHYMKSLSDKEKDVEGDIGLRPGDLLLKAQDIPLEDKKQKKVLHIFKKIKPNKTDGRVHINLVFRRWETRITDDTECTYEVDYQLSLVLEPELAEPEPEKDQQRITFRFKHRIRRGLHQRYTFRVADIVKKETQETEVPKGQIDDITPRGEEHHRIQSLHFGDEEFLTVDHDGLIFLKVWDEATDSKNTFTFSFFRGQDQSQEPLSQFIYCARISCPGGPVGTQYLTADPQSQLKFQTSSTQTVTTPDDVDGSCFILRELGDEVLFESLLHRGYYVGCESRSDRSVFFMVIEKSKNDVIHDKNLQEVKFKLWPVNEEERVNFLQVFQSLFSCAGKRSNGIAKRLGT